jgi:ribosome maturation protein Sdo1
MDTASKATLEDEFGTSRDDDVMTQILEKGSILETEVS